MDEIKLPEPVAWIAEYGGDIYTTDQLRAAVEADRERRQPTWDDLQQLAAKHGAWVSGYGPFAVELLATYGAAPEKQPHWVQEWLNAEASVRRHHQPSHQPLTDEQAASLAKQLGWDTMPERFPLIVRSVEQAHGIGVKND